jgi:hypothetical protein
MRWIKGLAVPIDAPSSSLCLGDGADLYIHILKATVGLKDKFGLRDWAVLVVAAHGISFDQSEGSSSVRGRFASSIAACSAARGAC